MMVRREYFEISSDVKSFFTFSAHMNATELCYKSDSSNILCMMDISPPEFKYLALDMPGKNGTETKETNIKGGESSGKDATHARPTQRSRKWERGWEHSPDYVLDIQKTAAIPSFSSDEEVTGVITMEDVIEELLQVFSLPQSPGQVHIGEFMAESWAKEISRSSHELHVS